MLLVGPGTEVYEGMVVGENARDEEMDVNPTKEKKHTNIRSASADEAIRLTPPLLLSLEQALEFIADDECVEVTPEVRPAAQGRARPDHPRPAAQPGPQGLRPRRRRGPAGAPCGSEGRARTSNIRLQRPAFCQLNYLGRTAAAGCRAGTGGQWPARRRPGYTRARRAGRCHGCRARPR